MVAAILLLTLSILTASELILKWWTVKELSSSNDEFDHYR